MVAIRTLKKALRLLRLFAVGMIIVAPGCVYWTATAPSRAIATAREWGKLAPLPASATEVRAVEYHNLFAGDAFIRFKAPPAEIEAFLAASPGLRGVTAEKFTPKHMFTPYPTTDDNLDEWTQHRHFSLRQYPPWCDPTIRTKGRRYQIAWHGKAYHGEVMVDDVKHIVFVRTSYS
jgi:hypothetical protein